METLNLHAPIKERIEKLFGIVNAKDQWFDGRCSCPRDAPKRYGPVTGGWTIVLIYVFKTHRGHGRYFLSPGFGYSSP